MILQVPDQTQELCEVGFATEKEMQRFCASNLNRLLGLQLIAGEFRAVPV